MVVYFGGCTWYYLLRHTNSEEDMYEKKTFPHVNNMMEEDFMFYLVKSCYYVSTTVNIIGYGELAPQTTIEKLYNICLELIGLIMAVYFLGQFIEIIIESQNMDISKQVATIQQEIELQGWLVLMNRYRDNKPIQVSLEKSLYAHFRTFWSTDRLSEITEQGYLEYLPK